LCIIVVIDQNCSYTITEIEDGVWEEQNQTNKKNKFRENNWGENSAQIVLLIMSLKPITLFLYNSKSKPVTNLYS
jgi:hypothetical protein